MADYTLGTAQGTVKLVYDGKGVTQANKAVEQFSRDANGRLRDARGRFVAMGDSIDGVGSSLDRAAHHSANFSQVAQTTGIAATALAAGIGLAVNAAIDFEKRISAIGAVSGASAEQMEVLRQKALQLGADTSFSASEAALAMEELVKAGLSVEDVMNGAADATVALAAAGEVSLPEAAAIASNAMNQFQLAAQDLPHIADLIAGAANASAIDVGEFGFALSQAGAVANLVGVNFDDLAVAIALMGNQGIKGSDAGTSLKTMLQNLQPTTERQITLMKELGILTEDGTNQFFNQRGELKSLAEVAEILNGALDGMTDAQKTMALETIFGADAIRAAAVIAGEGAEGFQAMADAIGNVSAQEVAAARLNNVAGAIEQLKGSVETAAIQLGTALLPVIRKVTEIISELVNRFSALDPKWQRLIAFGAVAVTAMLGVVAAIAAVGAAVAGVVASIAALKIAAIIAGVVAAIVAIAVAIKLAYDRSQEFRDLIGAIGEYFKRVFGLIMAVVTPVVNFIKDDLIPAVREIAQNLANNLAPAFRAIGDFMQQRVIPAVDKMRDAISKVMPYIISWWKILLNVAKVIINVLGKALGFIIPILLNVLGPVFSFIIDAIAGVISFIPKLIEGFKDFIEILKTIGKWVAIAVIAPFYAIYVAGKWVFEQIWKVVKVFIDAFLAVWNFLWPVTKAVFDLIVDIISLAFSIISGIFQLWWTGMKALWDFVWTYLIQPVVLAFTAIWNFLQAAWDVILGILRGAWDIIVGIWDKIYEWVVTPIVNAFNAVKDWISQRMEEVKNFISGVWDAIVGFFTSARDRIVGIINNFTEFVTKIREKFQQAKDAAIQKLQELITWVKELPGRILSALGDLGSYLFESGKALIQGFWDGMKRIWDNMVGWVEDGLSGLRDLWPFSPAKRGPFSGKGWVLYSGRAIMEGFAEGMSDRAGVVNDTAQRSLTDIAALLPTDHSAAVTAGQMFASGVSTAAGGGGTITTTSTYGDVHIHVRLEDLESVKDLEELWEWIDNLRNNSRRSLEVTTA